MEAMAPNLIGMVCGCVTASLLYVTVLRDNGDGLGMQITMNHSLPAFAIAAGGTMLVRALAMPVLMPKLRW